MLDALLAHRRKTDKEATCEKAQTDLLEFLGKTDASEVKLGLIPRIISVVVERYGHLTKRILTEPADVETLSYA